MKFIDAHEQAELLNMEEVVEAVAESLQAYSEGKTDTLYVMYFLLMKTIVI